MSNLLEQLLKNELEMTLAYLESASTNLTSPKDYVDYIYKVVKINPANANSKMQNVLTNYGTLVKTQQLINLARSKIQELYKDLIL